MKYLLNFLNGSYCVKNEYENIDNQEDELMIN
jgi:hypothetical protein